MGFKFFKQNIPDEPETTAAPQPLTINNRPAAFLQLNRGRGTISDDEWQFILQQQRRNLIEDMWEQGMIVQTIVSQDMDGLTLRTEILF